MLLRTITLANSGNVCLDGGGYILALGYECNRGIYQLQLRPTGEWDGLTIRACWHLPDGTSTTTLAVDGCMDVPAAVTALPGTGCITFEGAAEGKTITSSDLRYLVGDNSGVEDRTMPEPDTPAWEQLVGAVHTDATAAEQAKTDAQTAAQQAGAAAQKAGQALSDTVNAKEDALAAIGTAQTAATQAVDAARDKALKQVEASTEAAQTAASQAADSATKAEQAAQRAEDAATAASTIIDDTVIADSKTWSSKGIVDTLCPPIQATGNPVVCHPVAGYPLNVTVDFAPIQEGAGDPSPENIRPIKARESVDVLRCGVNVLDPHLIEDAVFKPYGLTITHIGGGKVHIEGVFTKATPEGSFVILRTKQHILGGKGLKAHAFVTKGNLKVISAYGFRNVGENVIALLVDWAPGTAIDIEVQIVVTPKDITPIAFTPYTGQTATLTLPTPCYGGELDAVTGKGQETWHTIVLTGQESSHIFEKLFYLHIENNPKPKDLTSGMSSHYKYATYGKGYIGVTFDGASAVLGAEGQFPIDEAGLNAWKSYLAAQYAAGTPIQIAYKVATPTPITATGGKPIPALAGTNTLLTDGDSLTVTGREDPTHKIQQLRAAVVALGGTI